MGKILIIKGADFSAVAIGQANPIGSPVITITSGGSVTIACKGATNIYYTTNGSTPTTSSTKYTSAFNVSTGTTVKAIAEFSGGTTSSVASKTYSGGSGKTTVVYPESKSVYTGTTPNTVPFITCFQPVAVTNKTKKISVNLDCILAGTIELCLIKVSTLAPDNLVEKVSTTKSYSCQIGTNILDWDVSSITSGLTGTYTVGLDIKIAKMINMTKVSSSGIVFGVNSTTLKILDVDVFCLSNGTISVTSAN